MKKRKRLLVILSTFVMAAQPLCVAAEMQDAEGFGAVEEIWADEENEEEFSAAPEVGNLVRSSPVLLQEIPLTAASAFFLWTITRTAMVLSWMEMQRPCMIFWCRIMWWITASIWTVLIFLLNFLIPLHLKQLLRMAVFREKEKAMYRLPMM